MAKLGAGDDRWIVKERDDGKNVNNWHWSETNLTQWSKEQLGNRLKDLVVREDAQGAFKILSLETMEGDVTIQSRKQKKFPLCAHPPRPHGRDCASPPYAVLTAPFFSLQFKVRARADDRVGGPAV